MKKGVVFLSCLLAVSMVGCNGGGNGSESKKTDTNSVVDISIGDWLDDDKLVELCRVVNVPSQAKILYTNGHPVDRVIKDDPVIITEEKNESVGNMAAEDYIWLSLEYDMDKGDIDRVSYGVNDSWSKIKDDEEFTKYSDTVVYDVDETDGVNIYMCLDEEADKSLGISASFNKTKMDDKAKVKMLLDSVDVIEKDRKELEPIERGSISQEDLKNTFTEKFDKVNGENAEGTEEVEESGEKEDTEDTKDSEKSKESEKDSKSKEEKKSENPKGEKKDK